MEILLSQKSSIEVQINCGIDDYKVDHRKKIYLVIILLASYCELNSIGILSTRKVDNQVKRIRIMKIRELLKLSVDFVELKKWNILSINTLSCRADSFLVLILDHWMWIQTKVPNYSNKNSCQIGKSIFHTLRKGRNWTKIFYGFSTKDDWLFSSWSFDYRNHKKSNTRGMWLLRVGILLSSRSPLW